MSKKKEVNKETDIHTFFDNIRTQIKLCENAIQEVEQQITQFVELANMINNDKRIYNLKYYFTDEGMTFERTGKKKIGFQGG